MVVVQMVVVVMVPEPEPEEEGRRTNASVRSIEKNRRLKHQLPLALLPNPRRNPHH